MPRRELKRISNSKSQKAEIDENMHAHNLPYLRQTNKNQKQEKRKSELTPTKLKMKKKIKILQQKIRRQTKKISSLKDINNHLIKKTTKRSTS